MLTRSRLWLGTAALYALFVFWYTDFKGPLTEEEIDRFVATMRGNGVPEERLAFVETFMREDSGRQFLMVNNLDMNDDPPDVEGAAPGESADKLMARYMEHMFPALLARACHPALMGRAVYAGMDIVGIEGAEQWSSMGLVRYRSRRALVEIISNPAFFGKHEFKEAALDKTIAYPIEMQLYLSDLRLLLALVLVALAALLDAFWLGRRR